MPAILYGTAWKKERTRALVQAALQLGFRGFDTACQPKHYHEPGVGEALGAAIAGGTPRESLYVQSKFTPLAGQDPKRVPYAAQAALGSQVRQSFAASLANLRVDYLDALLLHSPLHPFERTLEAWRVFEELSDTGGVRQLGISNCYELSELESLCARSRIPPAIVQNRFYADTGYDRELRAFCRRSGIVYQSFWTLSANPRVLAHATLRALALRYAATPAQVLFRYLTQAGVVPLTGTSSEKHMQEDLAIFDFELSAAECGSMATLFEG
jgi:diketogulonate reductase-like aldo/keto reductase